MTQIGIRKSRMNNIDEVTTVREVNMDAPAAKRRRIIETDTREHRAEVTRMARQLLMEEEIANAAVAIDKEPEEIDAVTKEILETEPIPMNTATVHGIRDFVTRGRHKNALDICESLLMSTKGEISQDELENQHDLGEVILVDSGSFPGQMWTTNSKTPSNVTCCCAKISYSR